MTDKKKEDEKDEKKLRIFHTGGVYGPLDTPDGRLEPGKSLPVRAALAKKLVAAYKQSMERVAAIPYEVKTEVLHPYAHPKEAEESSDHRDR